jgi:[ribosomal protein S5]-alanine N-acetyltransferase
MVLLETPRLLLRPLKLTDARQTQLLFPHWEIVRFLAKSIPWPYPADGALTYYRDQALPAMLRGDEWHWSLRLKTHPRQLIGCVSLLKTAHNNRGFWLGLPWQGQGLMSEAADAITGFWFEELGFEEMRVSKAAINRASRRISEKNGMRVIAIEEKEYVGGKFMTEVWSITAEEWRHRQRKAH